MGFLLPVNGGEFACNCLSAVICVDLADTAVANPVGEYG